MSQSPLLEEISLRMWWHPFFQHPAAWIQGVIVTALPSEDRKSEYCSTGRAGGGVRSGDYWGKSVFLFKHIFKGSEPYCFLCFANIGPEPLLKTYQHSWIVTNILHKQDLTGRS